MTKYLAQNNINIPGYGNISGPSGVRPEFTNLGSLVSGLLGVIFTLAAFIAFIMLIFGAFQYLLSAGDKGKIENARKRITWAIIGLLILSISFALAQFIQQALTKDSFHSPIGMVQTAYAVGPVELGDVYDFGHYTSLEILISTLTPIVFEAAAIILILYFLIAGIQLLLNAGDKEAVGKARQRITHTVIGFVLLILVYILFQYILQFFGLGFSIFKV